MDFNKLYINGKWVVSHSNDTIEVENPADMSIIAKVPRGNEKDVNEAVEAASQAFEGWRTTPSEKRMEYLQRALEDFSAKKDEILDLEVKELGAPPAFAMDSHVIGPIKRYENFMKIAKDFKYEEELNHAKVLKEPVGVVACLTPWNYPLGQVIQKVIPALLTGNTVVLKPSQNTPLTAYLLAQSFDSAGLPAGVFNLITGAGSEVGNIMASHPKVDMVSFTGSTSGGKEVAKLAIDSVKKISLELGGKSANVILEGADYKAAVERGLSSTFYNTGQTCAALTRMIVPKDDLKEIEQLIIEESKNFKVGSPDEQDTDIGPLSSKKQFDKVKKYLEVGLEEGAKLLIGEIPENHSEGYYVKPAVFTDVKNSMRIAQEEIFGPVMVIIPYDDVDEAVRIANDSIYGLSGAVFGPQEKAEEVAKKIRTGSVYVNSGRFDALAPFGGYKQSGIGREGGYYGIEEFLESKSYFAKQK